MKSEFDQEIDTLLRAHARRERVARAAQRDAFDGAQADAHLDADELSAYAEQALPATTRANYAAHLVACDACRAQVVMLTRAAGIAEQLAEQNKVPVLITPSWRERFAAFFAPGAWRYALPLVALFLVSGVVLWRVTGTRDRRAVESAAPQQVASAARDKGAPEYSHPQTDEQPTANDSQGVSKSNETATTAPAAIAGKPNPATETNAAGTPAATPPPGDLLARNESLRKQTEVSPVGTSSPLQSDTNAAAPAPYGQSAATNQPGARQNTGGGLNSQMNTQQSAQNVYAPAPPVSATAQTEAQLSRAQSAPEEEKAGGRARDAERTPQPTDKERSAKREADEPHAARDELGSTRGGPHKSAPASKPQRVADDKDKTDDDEVARTESRRPDTTTRNRGATAEDAGETRSVAGRQFRRQKSAWIDTAYRNGQATVNIRRNSEQWRALTADEPELRRIADTLGGEVVIVWHGRAYRIKQ